MYIMWDRDFYTATSAIHVSSFAVSPDCYTIKSINAGEYFEPFYLEIEFKGDEIKVSATLLLSNI